MLWLQKKTQEDPLHMMKRSFCKIEKQRRRLSEFGVCSLLLGAPHASSFLIDPFPRRKRFRTVAYLSDVPIVETASLPRWISHLTNPESDYLWSGIASAVHSASPILLAVVVIPLAALVVAIIQASLTVLTYRSSFSDVPLPQVPCHGVVLVGGSDNNSYDCGAARESNVSSLSLLLIGDSLAVGVGQSVTCTPIMPEVISKVISKATGKAVFWTVHGESGASTGWILRELERERRKKNLRKEDNIGYEQFEADGAFADDASFIDVWKERLDDFRQRFDPDSLGPYDIVVVLTGTNDLKIMLFPFLIVEEDKELRQQSKERGGIIEDLIQLMWELNERMERGLLTMSERIEQSIAESTEAASETLRELLFMQVASSNSTWAASSLKADSEKDKGAASRRDTADATTLSTTGSASFSKKGISEVITGNGLSTGLPLYVLPGMPSRALPAVRSYPLRWLALPVFEYMNDKKRDLAKSNPDVLFVEDPQLRGIVDYESRRGHIWEERSQEEVLFSIRAISNADCSQIEGAMEEYYEKRSKCYDSLHGSQPLSKRPGRPGTKIFSVDGIHPNESGYDYWSRHIANTIVRELKAKEQEHLH